MIMDDYFKEVIEHDFFKMFCGEKIGEGKGREVWTYAFDDKYVIKFETHKHSFQNVTEWKLWNDAHPCFPEARNWLAPCYRISECGRVLMQERTTPAVKFPRKVPAFLTDLKRDNFGMFEGRFVCHDYGYHLMCNEGLSTKMKKAKWRGEL